jgi:hypothetical protein
MTLPIKLADLAQIVGTTPKAVSRVLERAANGQDATKAFISLAGTTEDDRFVGLSKERAALLKTKRQLAEAEHDEKLGTLVDVEEVAEEVAAVFESSRHGLFVARQRRRRGTCCCVRSRGFCGSFPRSRMTMLHTAWRPNHVTSKSAG